MRSPAARAAPLALALALRASSAFSQGASPALAPAASAPPGDEAPVPGPPALRFEEAIARASASATSVAVAEAQLARAQAQWQLARASWLPTLSVNATFLRLDSDRVFNGRVIAGANQFNANVQAQVPLVAAPRWAEYARAGESVRAAQLSVDEARRAVAVAAARAFLSVSSQHRIAATLERALRNAEAHRAFAQQRVDGGVGRRVELLRAAQDAAVARQQWVNARGTLARLQSALGLLLGGDGPVDARDDVPEGAQATDAQARALREGLAAAEQQRAEVRAARARLHVAERAVADGWTDYLPTLLATVQGYYQNPPTLTQPELGWQAQLVLSVPLFDGGARYANARLRAASAREAQATLDGLLRQARGEVRAALESVALAEEAAQAAREAQRLADEALALADEAFRGGVANNLELVDAQRRARDAAAAFHAAEDNARQARLELLVASGRFPR